MWRFTQQRNDAGAKLNVYHVTEVRHGTNEAPVIGVFVWMNVAHAEAESQDELIELYTSDEMDSEFEDGLQEGYREASQPSSPPAVEETPPPAELPLEKSPLSVV